MWCGYMGKSGRAGPIIVQWVQNYPKPKRFPLGPKKIKSKDYLNSDEMARLLRGKVAVEEKMDGTTICVCADKFLVFAEDLKIVHSIYYRLPGRYAVFDIFDTKRGLFLYYDAVRDLANDMRRGVLKTANIAPILFFPVPLVAIDHFELNAIPDLIGLSAYARDHKTGERAFMEGIVVKPHRDLFPEEFLTGKLVRKEFTKGIHTSYLRLQRWLNAVDPTNTEVIEVLGLPNACRIPARQ